MDEFGRSRSRSPAQLSPSPTRSPSVTPDPPSDGIFVIPLNFDGNGGGDAIAAAPQTKAPPFGHQMAARESAPRSAPPATSPSRAAAGASAPPAPSPSRAVPPAPSPSTADSPADLQRLKAELLAFTRGMSQEELQQFWNADDNIEAERRFAVRFNVGWRERGPPPPGEGGPNSWKGATWRPLAKRWAMRGGAGAGGGAARTGLSSSSGDLGRYAAFWSRWYGEGVQALR